MDQKFYELYHNKEGYKMIIRQSKLYLREPLKREEVRYYNDWHYVSINRDKLKEKANELKAEWIAETEKHLKELNAMKIKVGK